jgi:hypothetical protein
MRALMQFVLQIKYPFLKYVIGSLQYTFLQKHKHKEPSVKEIAMFSLYVNFGSTCEQSDRCWMNLVPEHLNLRRNDLHLFNI